MFRRPFILMLLGGSLHGAAALALPIEIEIRPDERHQTWEGSGSCLVSWGDRREAQVGEKWLHLFADDLRMNILRVDLSPIVLGATGRHTYSPVRFGPEPAENLRHFRYDEPRNRRMTIFADAARRLRARARDFKVIATVWTPPHWMKTGSNLIHDGNDSARGTLKMDADNLEQYARYVLAAVRAFEEAAGVPVHALSVQNEPLFEMDFNSMKLSPTDYATAMAAVVQEFHRHKMATRFFGPESVIYGRLPDTWLIDQQVAYCEAMMKNPITAAATYAFAAHGYGGDGINSDIEGPGHWEYYWEHVKRFGKVSWQTETGGGEPDNALRQFPAAIMEGMLKGNIATWIVWQLGDGEALSEHTLLGTGLNPDNSKYHVAKHFFRHLRPGAVRVGTVPESQPGEFSVVAWVNPQPSSLTVVLFNPGPSRDFVLKFPAGFSGPLQQYQSQEGAGYRRRPAADLVEGEARHISVPGQSLTTLTTGGPATW